MNSYLKIDYVLQNYLRGCSKISRSVLHRNFSDSQGAETVAYSTYSSVSATPNNGKITSKMEQVIFEQPLISPNTKFDLITLIYDDFCPLSPVQRKILLKKFHNLLEKDGAILLDVLSIKFFNETTEKNSFDFVSDKGFWSPTPYYLFSNTFKYQEEKVVLDKYTIIEKTRTREIFNWLQCFNLELLEKEFQENGFRIIEDYSDVAGAPYKPEAKSIALIAEKLYTCIRRAQRKRRKRRN